MTISVQKRRKRSSEMKKSHSKTLGNWPGGSRNRVGSGRVGPVRVTRSGRVESGSWTGSDRVSVMGRAGRTGSWKRISGSLKLRHVARSRPWMAFTNPTTENLGHGQQKQIQRYLWLLERKMRMPAADLQAARDGASGGFWWRGWARWTRDGETKAVVWAVTNQSVGRGPKNERKERCLKEKKLMKN
ncbi:hypothetical protein PIB30_032632 [Stylosanthes scabra]|uniref:Uncharacterized protein n=1 Tax=Stylosanthes scabra TaxID=79078 RepID=A0ABU6VA94_9FABA|nr:hypothetical protein [Stylosanthes scabra]